MTYWYYTPESCHLLDHVVVVVQRDAIHHAREEASYVVHAPVHHGHVHELKIISPGHHVHARGMLTYHLPFQRQREMRQVC